MSALDKIRQAFPELANASDSEVLGEAARRTGVPVSQLSDTLGIAPSSTLGEIGKQLYAGVTVDAPRMAGQALKYYSDAGGERLGEGAFPRLGRATGLERQYGVEVSEAAPGYRAGQALVESADVRGRGMEPDLRGRGLIGEALVTGARGVGGIIPTLGLMAVPGGQALAPALQAALFGGSSAQDSYEKLVEQGVPEEEAAAAARRVWGIQGVGEGIATAGLGALLRPAVAAVRGARSTSGVAQALTDTSVLRPLAKGLAANIPLQAGTEAAQDVGTALVEQSYGAAPEDLGGIARGSALAGAGMTLLLGPLALGGSISRSRNAQRLTQALYGQDTAPEVREAARLEVMEAARQQGVDPANAEEWLQRQLREEAANIAAVQQQEEKTLADLAETPYADIAYALRDPELSAAMSEPDRTKLFSTLTALQNAETPAEQRDALVEDANETIGRYVAALQGPDAESDLTQPFGLQRQPLLTTPQPVQELNLAGGLTQVQTSFPDSLSAYQATAPAGREMPRAAAPAPVEGVEGIEAVRPGVFQVAQPLQQVGTFVGPRAPQPVTPPGAPTAVAAALPAAPAAAGVSSTTATTGAPSGTQAPKAVKAKTQRAKAPAAPAAAVVEAEEATDAKNVSEAIKEDNEIDRVLKAVEAEDDKADKLFASVTGDTKKAPGKPSMPTQVYAAIRNAILNPGKAVVVRKAKSVEKDAAATEKYGAKAKRIADAAREFAAAYEAYASQNLVRPDKVTKRTETADDVVAANAMRLKEKAAAAQQALAKLGEAVEGNAKDVEAIVRFVKDRAQKEKKGDVKVEKADITLSRAWTAAKSESFMGEPDLLATTGAEVRQSREATARGATPQLVDAATNGYATFGRGPRDEKGKVILEKGLNGILNYIRTVGTPFEKTLAQAIKLAVAGKAPINIKFVKEGTSQYDPKTNTITINETSSKEVALHEALHGALQWFVYTNPNAAQVVALKTALQRVVNYDGKLPPKAADVQALLKKILAGKSKTAELDAVLELVSYGNTLNEFRRALQAMESNAPRTFTKFANDVMDAIYALVRRMLGSNQTVASDVMENTFQLLEAARAATQETAPTKGNVLKAEVTSYGKTPVEAGTALPSKEADAINQQFQNPLTDAQYKALSTTLLPEQISSKFIFDMFGWAKVPGMAESTARKISDYIQKNHTGAAKVASWVNSHFGLQSGVREALIRAKDDKRGGSMIYNQIAQYFTNLPPQESVAVLEYMDAKLANLRKQGPAPVFPSNDAQMKDLADATITKWWEYARALRDPKQRDAYAGIEQPGGRWTGGVKFSQGLAFAENVDQLASPTFGVRNISQLISSRTKNEVTADAITFRTDANGDAILDDKFVGMYLLTPALKKRLDNTKTTAEASQILAELMPDEFISAAKLTTDGKPMVNAAGVQLIPDRNYLWDLQEKEKGGFKLTARLDAKQALLVKKGRDLGYALQNTMAILANSYSANRLTEALAEYEAKTPNAVAFNSLDDLNAMLNGEYKGDKFVPNTEAASWTTRVKQNQVVKLSDSEAKAETVKGLYRNRNQWVQLPNGPTYGALAGKIVNGSVWSAIEDMSDRRPLVNSAVYNGTMRWFKKAKTVYNPATWATNVASNFTMAMMDDIPLPTIGYATKLYVGYMLPPAMASKLGISLTREQQQLMLEIMKTNALLGDFSSTELKQSIYDSMRSTIGDTEQGVAERIMQFAKMEKDRIEAIKKYAGKGADAAERANQLLGDWYSMQDNIFRVASMLNNLGQQSQAGKPIDAEAYRRAGDHARFAFLDYDIDSKAVRIMRQTAFPFISWPYAAAKMIGNVAVHKPWKLVNLYAGLWILDGLTQAITGDDDDELRTSGPEWARNRMLFGLGPHTHIRVPFMGDSENPVYYDLGKYITPSSFGDRVPNAFLGLSWWPSFITPGGPYISSAIALLGGIDPYNGRPLSPPTDSDWEKLSDRLVYGQSLFAPNLPFLNARELAKAQEAFTATEGRSENYSSLYMARTAGLRLYDFNVQGALDQQDRAAKAIEREYKTEIGKLKRKMERLETPDWDAFYEREEELVKRMEKRIAEVRGGKTEEE